MKTVRVRIAVAVESSGAWNSCGWGTKDGNESDSELVWAAMEPMEDVIVRQYWVECDVPVPSAETVCIEDVTITNAEGQALKLPH